SAVGPSAADAGALPPPRSLPLPLRRPRRFARRPTKAYPSPVPARSAGVVGFAAAACEPAEPVAEAGRPCPEAAHVLPPGRAAQALPGLAHHARSTKRPLPASCCLRPEARPGAASRPTRAHRPEVVQVRTAPVPAVRFRGWIS